MTRHRSWRIIALVIMAVIFALIYDNVVSNSEDKLLEIYSGDYAYLTAELMDKLERFSSEKEQTFPVALLLGFKDRNPDLRNLAIIKDRYYSVHTDSSLVGSRINKEIFDAQNILKQNLVTDTTERPYVIWRENREEAKTYLLYYPVVRDGELIGTILVETGIISGFPLNISIILVLIALVVFFLLTIILDLYLPRVSFLFCMLLFIAIIIMVNGNLRRQMEETQLRWHQYKQEVLSDLNAYMGDEGIDLTATSARMELPLQQTLRTWNFTISFLGVLLILLILTGALEYFLDTIITNRMAYAYILPAMFGVFLLVFFPFIYGVLIGFTDYNLTNFGGDLIEYFSDLKNYGFDNFYNILRVVNFNDYSNFYYTLVHTIIWTISNLAFHVSIGVALALLLNDVKLKGRTVFRILLILPWAIPSYITALIWKGMFHRQFGAVNGLLETLGFESISWFTKPFTAYLANLATNVWLGFPFMMVIALGALQSIPKELYEASAIDGSSKWQTFWNVTVPLLRPAMVPAIILGTIWTFNQFNVIYLVSGGGPDGATELLITDAYKLAFAQYRYGYAAAYCIIIFAVLFAYGILTSNVTKATKGAYE